MPVSTETYSVATANPLATTAACAVLRDGGTAADALITAQTVLGLVEPQSSGLGGGSFLLYYNAENGTVDAYNARETAPFAASEDYLRYIAPFDHRQPQPNTRSSGRSIGVPGTVKLLEAIHAKQGNKPWRELFDSATMLADNGFPISPRMASSIASSTTDLAADPQARAYFLQNDGTPKAAGTIVNNPNLAKTLRTIATDGANAFYSGPLAQSIIDATSADTAGRTPGLMALEDLAAYQIQKTPALCTQYREHNVCGMPGAAGGISVASTLGILSNFDMQSLTPTEVDADGGTPMPEGVHLIAEAERLSYADRDRYVADPDFVPLPAPPEQSLLDPRYLRARSTLIDPNRSMGIAKPGDFGTAPSVRSLARNMAQAISPLSIPSEMRLQ